MRRRQDFGPRCSGCGKVCYLSKRAAKALIRQVHRGERLHAYKCGEYWHIGHLPAALIAGEFDRRSMENR